MSPDNSQILTFHPCIWLAFKGKNNNTNLILHVDDMEHNPDDADRLDLDQQIYFSWNSV